MKNLAYFTTSALLLSSALCSYEISEKGYWIGEVPECHAIDAVLGESIANFLIEENAETVVDFGCGIGAYVMQFQNRGLIAQGYDGNPMTPIFTNGACKVQDLSVPFQLDQIFDWVMSLEVGEHLPQQYETIFIENLIRHSKKGIILSWAIKNQGGTGHFNEQNNDYIKTILASYGYVNDLEAEKKLRSHAQCGWFKHSLMIFRKEKNNSTNTD